MPWTQDESRSECPKKECQNVKESAKINNFTPPPTFGVSHILMGTRLGSAPSPSNPPLSLGFGRYGKKSFRHYSFGSKFSIKISVGIKVLQSRPLL